MAIRDKKGEVGLNTTYLSLHYSYVVYASRKLYIRPGIQLSFIMNGVDYSKLRLREQIVYGVPVPLERPDFTPYNYMDIAMSVLAYTNNYWFGFKTDHLMRPAQIPNGKEKMPIYIDVYGGATLNFRNRLNKLTDDNVSFAFNFISAANFNQLEIGLMGLKNNVQLGFWYRGIPAIKKNPGSDAIIMSIGYIFNDFSIGYSHDFTISGLNNFANGSDEISVIYVFNKDKKKKKKHSAIKCPHFGR